MPTSAHRVDALAAPGAGEPARGRYRSAPVKGALLLQASFAVLPSMAALAASRPVPGALMLFGTLAVLLAYHALTRNRLAVATLIVAAVPAMMMLRVAFYFSSVLVVLALGLAVWHILAPRDFERLLQSWPMLLLLASTALYWVVSFIHTGQYASNLRALELSLTAATVFLLARYRSWLITAMLGFAIACFGAGLALLPHSERLGLAEFEEVSIGNPTAFGLCAALVFLLCVADGGRWLSLNRLLPLRIGVTAAASAFLFLSTSRGSWLVAAVGLALILFLGRGDRLFALFSLALAGIVLVALLLGGKGGFIERFYEKTFASERSLDSRTTGRYAQWRVFPEVIENAPPWGMGAGDGPAIYRRYSGRYLSWHSLYLHIGAELGLLGLTILAVLATGLAARGSRHRRRTAELVPLIGIAGFLGIGLSVSGLDAVSGVYLGLAAVAGDASAIYLLREAAGRAG